MARREYGQMGFADHLVKKRESGRDWVTKVEEIVDWRPLEAILAPINAAETGRKGYPPLALFKGLLLAQWYALSDPKLEDAVADRLSFRRFVGIPLHEVTPDETTFVRFRAGLREQGLAEPLFEALNRQLDAKGLMVKKGTIVDATIVEADAKRPARRDGEVSEVDLDASFTKKHGRSYFGYKLHVGVDEGSGLIRKLIGTTAAIHDSLAFKGLISGDETWACGDKAYGSEAHRKWLGDLGIADRLMHKAAKGRPLVPWQKWFNKAVSQVRSGVERVFGVGKRSYGLGRARYRGLERNETHFFLLAAAYNLRRSITLVG